ncbi:MAG: hypothetical protein JWR69_1771 [Pedosphaera sp.]|nr:hypothetical protein [Pedosphaera sp.]
MRASRSARILQLPDKGRGAFSSGCFERMKNRILYFVFVMLACGDRAWSQGTINFSPKPPFEIIFTGPVPPNAGYTPHGSADLSNNVFSLNINIGPTAATQGRVLALGVDNSLMPLFEITNQVNLFSFPGGPSYYSSRQSWQITDSQATSLWAGLWYVQFDFPTGTDTGAIVPVPEPSSSSLLILGTGLLVWVYSRKCFGLNQQSDALR